MTYRNLFSAVLLVSALVSPGHFYWSNKESPPPEPDRMEIYISTKIYRGAKMDRLTDYRMSTSSGWLPVDGSNSGPDAVTSFTAYKSEWPSHKVGSDDNRVWVGGFDQLVEVCSYRKSSVVARGGCQTLAGAWTVEFSFYVSHRQIHGTTRVQLSNCEQNGIAFSVIGSAGCGSASPSGDVKFYVRSAVLDCVPLDYPVNGRKSSGFLDSKGQRKVTFDCNPGYKMRGSSSTLCKNGRWTNRLPNCKKISCGRPTIPRNGQIIGSDFSYLGIVKFECNRGYRLSASSPKVRQCLSSGQWNDATPTCELVTCGYPGDINHGDIVGRSYLYGEKIRFQCDPGYYVEGTHEAECQASGSWSHAIPQCKQIQCKQLQQPANGAGVSSNALNPLAVDSEVVFQCHDGYTRAGPRILRCLRKGIRGVWDKKPPHCLIVNCPVLKPVLNGQLQGQDFTFGKEVKIHCNPGYFLKGTNTVTCQQTGAWDGDLPTCIAIQCSEPRMPDNAVREGDTTRTFGSRVRFRCLDGYTLQGKKTIVCQQSGRWSANEPTCEANTCSGLSALQHGSRDSDDRKFNTVVKFECFPGYVMVGKETTKCLADGAWTNTVPRCKPCPKGTYKDTAKNIKCKPCPDHSTTSTAASSAKQHCTCNKGSTGAAGGPCRVIKCISLTAPSNGRLASCGTKFNSECRFECEAGYILLGSRLRQCTANGWNGNPPVCTACPSDTYKGVGSSSTCLPCPRNSYTPKGQLGTSIESCKCGPGWINVNGKCEDINECQKNSGCSDQCENNPGSFVCSCTIPGNELDSDKKTCIVKQTCTRRPDNEPANGHLSCEHVASTNGDNCRIKCDPGFFFVSGENNYVTCGSETGFTWSHQAVNKSAIIRSCTEEFFVDVTIGFTLNYQTTAPCNIAESKRQLTTVLHTLLNGLPSCTNCTAINIAPVCHGAGLTLDFDVLIKNTVRDAVGPNCTRKCRTSNMREVLGELRKIWKAIPKKLKSESTSFNTDTLTVDTASYKASRRPYFYCEDGKVLTKSRQCVPCDVGYHFPQKSRKDAMKTKKPQICLPCPVGTFQDGVGKTECTPCYRGSTTLYQGSTHPTQCNQRIEDKKTFTIKGMSTQ